MSARPLPPWTDGLGAVSERRRRVAVERIARMRPAPVAELRSLANGHHNAYMRAGALAALIRIRPRDLRALLIRATRDPAMTVRMRVLGAVRGPRADARILSRLIADDSGGVRVNAVDLAASLRVVAAAGAIRQRFDDEKWYVRQHAARAAGVLRDARASTGLHRLSDDPRPAVRREAAQALAMLNR